MKKIIPFLIIAAVLSSCGGAGKYTITGTDTGIEGKVYLLKTTTDTTAIAQATDGNFKFSGKIDIPEVYLLTDESGKRIQLFLEKGADILISRSPESQSRLIASGTKAHDSRNAYSEAERELVKEYREADEQRREEIIEQANELGKRAIEENRDNLFGMQMLRQSYHGMEPEEVLESISAFAAELQRTQIAEDMKSVAEAQMRASVGNKYMEIQLPDKDGNIVSLSSLVGEGQYVLVDFWATWCGPCMQELPYLLDAYEKYHWYGFEIYGVSLDTSREKWVDTVAEKNMAWLHVSELKGWESTAGKSYGVNSIPASFLIGPDGTIVAKNLRGEELLEKLGEIYR